MKNFVENPWIDGFIYAAIAVLIQGFVLDEPANLDLARSFGIIWAIITGFRLFDRLVGDDGR